MDVKKKKIWLYFILISRLPVQLYAKQACYSTQIECKMVRIRIADALDSAKNVDVITVFDEGQNIWEDALWKQ